MASKRWFLFFLAACAPDRSSTSDETLQSPAPSNELSVEGSGALFATNPTHVLRATFEPDRDVVVGAYGYDHGQTNEGRAFLCTGACIDADADADGVCESEDCDDTDATVYPGALELCDGLDNACAGSVPANEVDADGDGWVGCAGDCDDNDPRSYPGGPELCDGLDNTCAGSVPANEVDADGDGWVGCAGDCDDNDPRSYPGGPELCDGLDNSCVGFHPNEVDADNDGFSACAGDCDDADLNTSPILTEVCGDEVDNDCDGVVDQNCAATAGGCGGCDGTNGTGIAPLAVLAAFLVSLVRRSGDHGPMAPARLPQRRRSTQKARPPSGRPEVQPAGRRVAELRSCGAAEPR